MPDERIMFILGLETAMRMRECYTLELSQVSLDSRTVHLSRTNNGDNRQFPLSSPALHALKQYIAGILTRSLSVMAGYSRFGMATVTKLYSTLPRATCRGCTLRCSMPLAGHFYIGARVCLTDMPVVN
jgi:integrase